MHMPSMVSRLQAAPRCGAHSKRTKMPCRAPAVRGYRVCRFHGARGGAPCGNRNAWKHGIRGQAWLGHARGLRALVRGAAVLVSASKLRVHGVVRSNIAGVPPTPSRSGPKILSDLAPDVLVHPNSSSWPGKRSATRLPRAAAQTFRRAPLGGRVKPGHDDVEGGCQTCPITRFGL